MPSRKKKPAPKKRALSARQITSKSDGLYIVRIASFKELKKPVKRPRQVKYKKGRDGSYTTVTYRGKTRITSRYYYTKDVNAINPLFDRAEKKFRKSDADDFAGSAQKVWGRISNRYKGTLSGDAVALKSAKHRSIKKKDSRGTSTALRVQMEFELRQIVERGAEYTVGRFKREHKGRKKRRIKDEEIDE